LDRNPNRTFRILDTEGKCKKAIEVYYWWPVIWKSHTFKHNINTADKRIVPICHFHKKREGHKYDISLNAGLESDYSFRKYRCKINRKIFNVATGTIFYDRRIPLRKWFEAFWYYKNNQLNKESIRGIASKIIVDKRTLADMLGKFENLSCKDKNLLYDIKNKYNAYLGNIKGNQRKRDTRILTDEEIYKKFGDDYDKDYIKSLLYFRKMIEEGKIKNSGSDIILAAKKFANGVKEADELIFKKMSEKSKHRKS
jgi:hypothetical protein